MTASVVASLVASAVMCAVLAAQVEVERPMPALDVISEHDEVRSAWTEEVFVEAAIRHEPCDVLALERRLWRQKLAPQEHSRLLVEVRRCGGRWGEEPQCERGPDGYAGCARF